MSLLSGTHLLSPWLFVLVLLIPAALLLRRRRGEPPVTFGPGRFLVDLPRGVVSRLLFLPRLLFVLGLLLLVAALARPVTKVLVPESTEGIDIMLCLDLSSSMAANDLDPGRTRLDLAKEAASRFVAGRENDRIGLVTFARYPDLRCPLTLDHEALSTIISGVELVLREGPEDATGIGAAVTRAAQVLSGAEERSRVVILLTDGEENVATAKDRSEIAPLHAGQLCRQAGVRVYIIAAGLGSTDDQGEWVPADTSAVEELAARTGGRFFTARDAEAVAGVYAGIDQLETRELDEPRTEVRERFLPLLFAALALLLIGRITDGRLPLVLP